jgi:EAL and modified HD-GYP domain-containing signal transduction protein
MSSTSSAAPPARIQQGAVRGTVAAAEVAAIALVARQPIFDTTLSVVAYELLYRTPGELRALVDEPTRATAQVMVNAALDIGIGNLVGSHAAYINFPPELIGRRYQPLLPPERVVIEVLEGSDPGEELLLGLRQLRAMGYRIALDDYDIRRESQLLLEYADIVKVDVREHSPAELAASVAALSRHPVRLVAEKIETREELAYCRKLGFHLFQGYFLQKPEIVRAKRVPCDQQSALDLIMRLSDATASVESIERAIRRDVGLSCRILRCVNSSYFLLPRKVSSIRESVMLLGLGELQKLGWLMLLAGLAGQPTYLCIQSLLRARMCEALCQRAQLPGADSYFMTGMLSMLDVFSGQPMLAALETLPLHHTVRDALLLRAGDLGAALHCVESYERGAWEQLRFRELGSAEIAACYVRATEWADATWRGFRGGG